MQNNQLPITAVYIHIPFCIKKCNYCDFLSFSSNNAVEDFKTSNAHMEQYVQALIAEMHLAAKQYPVAAETIFIGGGTPSVLSEALLEPLLEAIQHIFITESLKEYTVELNPGTITLRKLQLLQKYGVNRLSIGVQSDDGEQLRFLGRVHTFSQAQEAVQMARDVGFQNINLDFMYGIPGQTIAMWKQTLQQAIALEPEHLSLYQLKIEEGTVLNRWLEQGEIEEFDDEVALELYRMAQETLFAAGYTQYEISNYAKKGYESQHNQVYWRTDNYLGLGLGACSWIRPNRWNNCFQMDAYLQKVQANQLPIQEDEHLSVSEQMEETVFMALRMNEGLSKALFYARFSVMPEAVFAEPIARCKANGWLVEDSQGYRLTEEGRVLGNLVFMEFIAIAEKETIT